MGKMLDRLAKRLWVAWFACVGVGVASMFLEGAGYDGIVLILSFAVVAAMLLAVINHLSWYSRARETIGHTELREVRYHGRHERDWLLLALVFTSLLAIVAVYVFDLTHDLIMPLVASVMVPLSLQNRNALVALLASRQPAN